MFNKDLILIFQKYKLNTVDYKDIFPIFMNIFFQFVLVIMKKPRTLNLSEKTPKIGPS